MKIDVKVATVRYHEKKHGIRNVINREEVTIISCKCNRLMLLRGEDKKNIDKKKLSSSPKEVIEL